MSPQDSPEPDSDQQASDPESSDAAPADVSSSATKSDSGSDPGSDLTSDSQATRRRGGAGLLLVALLALAALAVALYPLLDQQDPLEDFAVLETSLEDLDARISDRVSGLSERLGTLEQALEDAAADRDRLASRLDRRLDEAASERRSLAGRIDGQERSLEALETELGAQLQELWQQEGQQREVDRDFARRMHLLEAASLLRLGQERAELAADWTAARLAYERAEQLLREVDDPRLGQVRRLLAAELTALESAREPDWERWKVRLTRIGASVAQWPVRAVGQPEQAAADAPPEGAGWLNDMRSALGRLVTVSRRDERELPEEVLDSLREQLQLRLVAAELALVRRNLVELGHQLRASIELIDEWFDPDDADIAEARERLQELLSIEAPGTPAGLGEALRALQSRLESA